MSSTGITALTQAVITLLNGEALRRVNTGDRTRDGALVAIFTLITSAVVTFIGAAVQERLHLLVHGALVLALLAGFVAAAMTWWPAARAATVTVLALVRGRPLVSGTAFPSTAPKLNDPKLFLGPEQFIDTERYAYVNFGTFASSAMIKVEDAPPAMQQLRMWLERHQPALHTLKMEAGGITKHCSTWIVDDAGRIKPHIFLALSDRQPLWYNTVDDAYVYLVLRIVTAGVSVLFVSTSSLAIGECVMAYNAFVAQKPEAKTEKAPPLIKTFVPGKTPEVIGSISARCTFDSLFFPGKTELVRLLDAVRTNTLVPPHVDVPSNLLVLLHGEKGCGKTASVCAAAQYLNRPLLIVSLMQLRTRDEFRALLRLGKDHVLLLDELDCVEDVLLDAGHRKSKQRSFATALAEENALILRNIGDGGSSNSNNNLNNNGGEDRVDAARRRALEAVERAKQALDLEFILSELSGAVRYEGLVAFATTNHPDKLDPRLLRPGRFGFQFEFKGCDRASMLDIVAYFYKLSEAERVELAAQLPDGQPPGLTPTALLQALMVTPRDNVARVLHAIYKTPA